MPPSISRAGAGACTTVPGQARQASFGRRVTITRNCAGTTSSRSEVSSPITVIVARQHGHAVSSGASVTSIRGKCAGSAPRLARRLVALSLRNRGILQCDGYAAYKKFGGSKSADPAVTLAFCWSHVRRGFYDLAKAKAPIAIEALKRIAALYAIEADIRGQTATERRTARQADSKPLIAELRVWFEAQLAKLPARGPT